MSIKFKILLSMLIMVLSVVSLVSYSYIKNTEENIKQLAVEELETIGFITEDRIKQYMKQLEDSVYLFSSRLLLGKILAEYADKPDKKIVDTIKTIVGMSYTDNGNIEDIIVLDGKGNIVTSKSGEVTKNNFAAEEMFKKSSMNTYMKLNFSSGNKPLIYVGAPILRNGSLVGVAVFKINLDYLNKLLNQRDGLGKTGEALVGAYNKKGELVLFTQLKFASSPLVVPKERTDEAVPMRLALGNNVHRVLEDQLDYRKEPVISSVHYFKPLNIGIVIKKDLKDLMNPVFVLKRDLLAATAISVVIAIIISLLLSYYMGGVINQIVEVASKIANGDFAQRADVSSNDEIGMLAGSVNKMAESLININQTLEERVEEQTKELTYANEKLNYIFDITPNITIVTSGETIIKANRQFLQFTGFRTIEDFSRKYKCICDMFTVANGYLKPEMDNGMNWVEYVYNNPQETHKAMIIKNEVENLFFVNAAKYMEKGEDAYIVVMENITQLQEMAYTDQLTSLANRLKIDEVLNRCCQTSERYKNVFSVIMVDIDFFKSVNDEYGHLVGDEVLKQIAEILDTRTRRVDLVGRWGGEEFIIISKETGLKGATVIAEKVRKRVEEAEFSTGAKHTISLGVAEHKEGETIDELLKRVDDALYKAKNNGRNRVEIASN